MDAFRPGNGMPEILFSVFLLLVYMSLVWVQIASGHRCYVCAPSSNVEEMQAEMEELTETFPDVEILKCNEYKRSSKEKFIMDCPTHMQGCLTTFAANSVTRRCGHAAIDECKSARGIMHCYCKNELCNNPDRKLSDPFIRSSNAMPPLSLSSVRNASSYDQTYPDKNARFLKRTSSMVALDEYYVASYDDGSGDYGDEDDDQSDNSMDTTDPSGSNVLIEEVTQPTEPKYKNNFESRKTNNDIVFEPDDCSGCNDENVSEEKGNEVTMSGTSKTPSGITWITFVVLLSLTVLKLSNVLVQTSVKVRLFQQ